MWPFDTNSGVVPGNCSIILRGIFSGAKVMKQRALAKHQETMGKPGRYGKADDDCLRSVAYPPIDQSWLNHGAHLPQRQKCNPQKQKQACPGTFGTENANHAIHPWPNVKHWTGKKLPADHGHDCCWPSSSPEKTPCHHHAPRAL